MKYPNVTMKRGITGNLELFDWWKAVRDGQLVRRNVTITLLDEQRQAVQTLADCATPGRRRSRPVR